VTDRSIGPSVTNLSGIRLSGYRLPANPHGNERVRKEQESDKNLSGRAQSLLTLMQQRRQTEKNMEAQSTMRISY
jgi:hypothetical protein